jgi:hypothetical protein
VKNFDHIDQDIRDALRTEWSALRGQGNMLDHARGHFLDRVLRENCDNKMSSLESYIIGELEEYAGKRTKALTRLATTFRIDSDAEHWRMIGGQGMVILARLNARLRRLVVAAVRAVLKNTGRDTLSTATFRNIVLKVVGREVYKAVVCVERRSGGDAVLSYRDQAAMLRDQVLRLLPIRGVRERITPEVKVLLGIRDRRSARRSA